MSFWDKTSLYTQMAKDLGFEEYQNIPQFVYELIDSLIESGWHK